MRAIIVARPERYRRARKFFRARDDARCVARSFNVSRGEKFSSHIDDAMRVTMRCSILFCYAAL
jgi:hypothetical protein